MTIKIDMPNEQLSERILCLLNNLNMMVPRLQQEDHILNWKESIILSIEIWCRCGH